MGLRVRDGGRGLPQVLPEGHARKEEVPGPVEGAMPHVRRWREGVLEVGSGQDNHLVANWRFRLDIRRLRGPPPPCTTKFGTGTVNWRKQDTLYGCILVL